MRIGRLTSCISALFIAIAPANAAAQAHELEQVKTVFEHAIPNIKGKSLIALEVSYPPGGKSPSITMLHRPSSTLMCCPAPFAARSATSPSRFTESAKAFTKCLAPTTG